MKNTQITPTKDRPRKLATKFGAGDGVLYARCGHCKHSCFPTDADLKEVGRINISDVSAQITYNFDCKGCLGPNQINLIVD